MAELPHSKPWSSFLWGLYTQPPLSQRLAPSNLAVMDLRGSMILDVRKATSSFSWTSVLFFFFLKRAVPVAYGGFRTRGRIRAVATATATWDPSRTCDLHHSSRQCWILNPLRARPGMEPVSAWMLVRFVSTEPRWEFPSLTSNRSSALQLWMEATSQQSEYVPNVGLPHHYRHRCSQSTWQWLPRLTAIWNCSF